MKYSALILSFILLFSSSLTFSTENQQHKLNVVIELNEKELAKLEEAQSKLHLDILSMTGLINFEKAEIEKLIQKKKDIDASIAGRKSDLEDLREMREKEAALCLSDDTLTLLNQQMGISFKNDSECE